MSKVLLVQVSAFGNKRILPESGMITELMKGLNKLADCEFLPSVIPTPNFDNEEMKIALVSNLVFITKDNECQIICVDKRIDCALKIGELTDNHLDEKFNLAAKVVSYIMKQSDVFANRLAINIQYESNSCNGSSNFEKKIIKVPSYYSRKTIKEWENRINGLETIMINGQAEPLNVITAYSRNRYKLSKGEQTKIQCHSDVNTVAENSDFRFQHTSVESFVKQAKQIFDKLYINIEELTK